MRYHLTEDQLPARMRRFLSDIDAGRLYRAGTLQKNRPSVSSALRGLIDTARIEGLPEKLCEQTAGAFISRLEAQGWQKNSLIALKTLLRHYAYETGEGLDWALGSGTVDRRPIALVFRVVHWRPFGHLFEQLEADVSAPDIRMVDRWMRYRQRFARVDEEMVRRFDVSSRCLGKLSELMTAIDPGNPDNLVLQQVQRKRRQESERRGRTIRTRRVPWHDIPAPFQEQIAQLAANATGLSRSRIKAICSAVRRLCRACETRGLAPKLDRDSARAFVDDLFEDDLKLISVAGYCDFLACFAKHAGYPRDIFQALMDVQNATKFDAKTDLRRKELRIEKWPINLVDLACTAHALLEAAPEQDDIRNRRRDYVLAGSIALLTKLPLRAKDLRKALIGREFCRDSEGWRVDLNTSKTGTAISGQLADSLTRYLDAVMLMDVDERHLWQIYQSRMGTALFGNPARGWKAFGKNWLWHNMSERTEHGPHITRSLLYDAVAANSGLDLMVAQALCGHASATSRKHYELNSDRYRRGHAMDSLAALIDRESEIASRNS